MQAALARPVPLQQKTQGKHPLFQMELLGQQCQGTQAPQQRGACLLLPQQLPGQGAARQHLPNNPATQAGYRSHLQSWGAATPRTEAQIKLQVPDPELGKMLGIELYQ